VDAKRDMALAGGSLHGRHDVVVAPRKVRDGELERRRRAAHGKPGREVRARVLGECCRYRRGSTGWELLAGRTQFVHQMLSSLGPDRHRTRVLRPAWAIPFGTRFLTRFL